MGGSKWMKMALGLKLNSCLQVPRTVEESPVEEALPYSAARVSDAVSLTPTPPRDSRNRVHVPTTPTPSSSGLLLPIDSSESSKMICAICLTAMKPGHGQAIFKAECSHSFHFDCIASNVKHGKKSCPLCRKKWEEIPSRTPATQKPQGRRSNNLSWPENDAWTTVIRRLPPPRLSTSQNISSIFHAAEPGVFDDDDEVTIPQWDLNQESSSSYNTDDGQFIEALKVETYPEISSVPKSKSHNNFSVLVHLKAPVSTRQQHAETDGAGPPVISRISCAPVDLVTVLDVSGSMAGTKLALLKQAMGFVIQNLGPFDRLSVIAFSSSARRLFPLRRMTEIGRQEALQAVNSLISNGGTNIAEGLRKAAKVITDRKWKNPVSSIILLSDGQDTYNINNPSTSCPSDYRTLVPVSMHQNGASSLHIPIHAFGFGADHDAVSMHSISEASGGTFSFIEAESVIQNAFAQCMGGLLSVVIQELKVEVECIHPMLQLVSIKSGSYRTTLVSDQRKGIIEVGDLYAEEERDFLVTTDIPIDGCSDETALLKVRCIFKHSTSERLVTLDPASEVKIQRPVAAQSSVVSVEVDRHMNRLRSAEAMAKARAAAEGGDLTSAVSVLENCRKELSETVSARAGDRLCVTLDAELREMKQRMANRRVYETSGRAYVLSGLSSHSWQRATARGDSTDSTSLVQAYQTPSMADMVNLSQTMSSGNPSPRPAIRPTQPFPVRLHPR
ncbi:E3 ubiquitin-protein ligase WAV3 [Sesamum alatum]|uniref:E3 ubiquitin-protein ligase WAV3 n=1 Tax=Sesamum alatum TaxID=300844 RepID=A0AAE1Z2Q5_9LAMI|nr:E3 ubiquitin-protein ligase WAV3 [Sesamum alatum]